MKWNLDKSKLEIVPYPAAHNEWCVRNKDTNNILKIYTEKGMYKAWIECDGDISF